MTISTHVKKDGSAIERVEEVDKALTEMGRSQLSIKKVHFHKSSDYFKLVEAYALTRGQKTTVKPTSVQFGDLKTSTPGGLSDLREATILFDNVKVGTEVHLVYDLLKRPYIGKLFSGAQTITNVVLAKKEEYTYASESPLLTYEQDFDQFYGVEKKVVKGIHSIRFFPTQVAYGLSGKREARGTFFVTNAKNWSEVRKLEVTNFAQVLNQPLPESYQKIAKTAGSLSTPQEVFNKVAAELNKKIAYSGDWQTKAGKLQPKPMKETAASGKGDCKDYTVAMVAILRKLGYEAFPFLTFRSPEFVGPTILGKMSQVPVPGYFNHVIVHVLDKEKKSWWIDPTNPYVQAGTVTRDILGNFGLLLDEKSENAMFLPAKNPDSADSWIEQTLTFATDSSVSGTGFMKFTPSAYNSMAMFQRTYGNAGAEKIFAFLLNIASKSTTLHIVKSNPAEMRYDYSLHASDWAHEALKSKSFIVMHPATLLATRLRTFRSTELGELGLTTLVTHIKGEKLPDVARGQCFMRSRWADAERVITNEPDGIQIKDILKIKERFIPKSEANGDLYESFISDIAGCAQTSNLIVKLDSSLKTAEDLETEKEEGLPLDAMNDQEADRLYELEGPGQTRYVDLKLVRYYEKKLEKNPKDAQAEFRIGASIIGLGYLKGDIYVPAHLDEGLMHVDRALAIASPEESRYQARKVRFLIFRNKIPEAVSTFNDLHKKYPKSFDTFLAASELSVATRKHSFAEGWLKAGEALAKTPSEKKAFHRGMNKILSAQGRFAEAIPHQEALAKMNPKNAWAWHNLAALYFENQNYDKAIEFDKKALEIKEFGVAKRVLSDAYLEKYKAQLPKATDPMRLKLDLEREAVGEELLLMATKYDPTNVDVLATLALFYWTKHSRTKDQMHLAKGKDYLAQASQIDPNNPTLSGALIMYSLVDSSPRKPASLPSRK